MRRLAILAAAVTVSLLAGCSPSAEPTPTATPTPNADASVNVRLVLEPSNLDIRQTAGAAVDQALMDNVYQGLVARTPEQEIVPSLASEWKVSDDALTYEFTLREDVKFHDGAKLTSADVVWSLKKHRDEKAWRDQARLAAVKDVKADGQKITITLSKPDSTLLWNLTGRAGVIFKKDDKVDYKLAENGTGPFTVASWKQGSAITLDRFEDYWGEPAAAAEVVLAYVPDNQAALNGALNGDFDVVTGFDPTLKDQIEANGAFTLTAGPSTDKGVLAMNSTKGALADKRVRQAIRQAINHDALVSAIGAGSTLYGPIPSLDPGYEDLSSLVPYDPAAAKKLLADAGQENLALTLTIPAFYGTTIPTVLVSDLDEVGVTLTVNSVDFPTWISEVYSNKNYDLSFVLHTEARDFENWANPDYYFTYDNKQVQDLYAKSLAATTEEEAASLLAQAAKIVSEDMAADWLYNGASVVATSPAVSGMPDTNVNERLDLVKITKSSE